jgi:hypothetical protein
MPYNFLSGLDLTGMNYGAAPAQIQQPSITPLPAAQPMFQPPFIGGNNYGLGNSGYLSNLDLSSYQNPSQQTAQNAPALATQAPALAAQAPALANNLVPATPPLTGPASQQLYTLNPGEDYDDYTSRVTAAQQADPNFNRTDYQQALRTGTGIAALAPPPPVNQLPPPVNQLPPPVNQLPPPVNQLPPPVNQLPPPDLNQGFGTTEPDNASETLQKTMPAMTSQNVSSQKSGQPTRNSEFGIRPFDGTGLTKTAYDIIVSKDGDKNGDAYISTNEWTNWTLDKGPTATLADTWSQRMEDTRNNADEYGISASTLARLNELDANGLQIGRENFYADKNNSFAYDIGAETKYVPMTFRENGSRALSADARLDAQSTAYAAIYEDDPEDIEVPANFYEAENKNKLDYYHHLLKVEDRPELITETPRDGPEKDDDDPEETFWWDKVDYSNEGVEFTGATSATDLGSAVPISAIRVYYKDDAEGLANFNSWMVAHPKGFQSEMWNKFFLPLINTSNTGVGSGPATTVPVDKVAMLQDSSNYTVGDRVDQLRQAVPIPDGGRVATDFELKYEGVDGPIRDPGTGAIISPARPDNPFNSGNRPPGTESPFERPLGPAAPFARGGVVKPLTGIQTLGR